MTLNIGDIILIHGWVMLKNLDDGQKYKVSKIKTLGEVDLWVNDSDNENLNGIEIIKKGETKNEN